MEDNKNQILIISSKLNFNDSITEIIIKYLNSINHYLDSFMNE